MKKQIKLIMTLSLALLFGFSFWVFSAKADNTVMQFRDLTPDCQGCHYIIREHWEEGSHGQAYLNPEFQAAWNAKGNPNECLACHASGFDPETNTMEYEGVACTTCHTPVNQNHPNEVMPTNVASRDCGECHLETFSEWETSIHGQEELSCVRCHNSHTTGIKAVDSQTLCETCHNEKVHYFGNTTHAEEGLLCTDCHLVISDSEIGDGHGSRMHTFSVDMDTCSKCHSEMLHNTPSETDISDEDVLQSGFIPDLGRDTVEEPNNVSPIGFAILGTLVGTAFGMLLSPWLERWFARFK